MTQTLQTSNPLLREVEASAIEDLQRYRRFAHIDRKAGISDGVRFWRRLARVTVRDIRDVRRTQAELG